MITWKKLVVSCLTVLSLSNPSFARNIPDWTFAVYMEAGTPDMYYWLHRNMNDMALAVSNRKTLNIVTQVHVEQNDAWRYVIRNNMIKPKESVTLNDDMGKNLVDFMQFVVKNHPAKHYGLILWGHGFGILDPTYRPTSTDPFQWDVDPDEPGHECINGVCPLKSLDLTTHEKHRSFPQTPFRGLLFTNTQTFINNAAMVSALQQIKETVLKGKKLDILGTDCCKMAMIEIGYQIKSYVDFLVGSQNCELKDGWDYKGLFSSFNDKPLTPCQTVQAIVSTYGNYYKQHTVQNTYTLSAIDLTKLDPLIANINDIAHIGQALSNEQLPAVKAAIFNARMQTPSMCNASYYLDLGTLYANIKQELDHLAPGTVGANTVTTLQNLCVQGQALMNDIIVANTTGTAVEHFKGVSIYFPRNHIDPSYLITPFGQETAWLGFLQTIMG